MSDITVQSTMREILEAFPGAGEALKRDFHVGGCSSCGYEPEETLLQVLQRNHILDYKRVLQAIRHTGLLTTRLLVEPAEAARLLAGPEPPALVDLRDEHEHHMVRIEGSRHLGHDLSYEILQEWPKDRAMIVYDHRGDQGLEAARFFDEHGFTAVRALRGGLDAWTREIDPDLPRYGAGAEEWPVFVTARPDTARFRFDDPLLPGATAFFASREEAAGSPLAEAVFERPDVVSVIVAGDTVSVTRDTWKGWAEAALEIGDRLARHLASGSPHAAPGALGRTRPAEEVARAIEHLLGTWVNPSVASHGGEIRLVEYRDGVAHLEMGGGCQGCGSAQMTLRQGVEALLREKVPEVVEVRDVTDHAAGLNPYYS